MILIVIMNLFIDIFYFLDELKIDIVNCVVDVIKMVGGKGFNVIWVFLEFGDFVFVIGLVGGKFGEFLVENIDD